MRGVIDKITHADNHYVQLQPEPDLTGEYGNGWKGVWKWCRDNAGIKERLIKVWLGDLNNTCIVIPCDSTEAWVIAAYDEAEDAELIEDPWINRIAKKKYYHNIRISGNKKRARVYVQFVNKVCENWT